MTNFKQNFVNVKNIYVESLDFCHLDNEDISSLSWRNMLHCGLFGRVIIYDPPQYFEMNFPSHKTKLSSFYHYYLAPFFSPLWFQTLTLHKFHASIWEGVGFLFGLFLSASLTLCLSFLSFSFLLSLSFCISLFLYPSFSLSMNNNLPTLNGIVNMWILSGL